MCWKMRFSLSLAVVAVAGSSAAVGSNNNPCMLILADDQDVKVEAYGANAVRVRSVPKGGTFRDDLISALVPQPIPVSSDDDPHPSPRFDLKSHGATNLTNGNINAAMGADGKLVFTRVSDNKVLLTEKTVRQLIPTTTTPSLPGFFALNLDFEAVDGERIYGLGQHKTGVLDNKGVKGLLLNPHNTEILVPVAHSSEGYAFLFNLPSFGRVEYNDTDSYWHADAVVQADFWVGTTVDGPTHAVSPWAQLQSSYADVTGHAPVYPEWSSGFWQCRNRYHNQTQIMDVAQGYVDREYPISLIIIDYHSWEDPDGGNTPLGDETLPKSCWPDPRAMVDQLKAMGVELMISPYFHSVNNASKNYPEALNKGYFALTFDGKPAQSKFGDAYLYDVFNQDARAYAFKAVQNGYMKYGLHHWWLDCDEPCGAPKNLVYNNGTWPESFVGAAYPHMLDVMVWEGMGSPGKEYEHDNVMLGRSAWAGSQRYGAAVWSGDTHSTFTDLNQQFRAGLNMVMSGIPYWTTDIGGYAGGDISSPGFRELIVRWFQWGAFNPIFRLHGARRGGDPFPPGPPGECGTSPSNEIWNFGPESEAAIARVMRIREQMRPYIMERYAEASIHGTPVMRPLFFDFWKDAGSQHIEDQLMFGPEYMLAPQLNQNGTSRAVYLPQLPSGFVWQNVFTKVETGTSAGGKTITEGTPLTGDGFGTFPLYRKVTRVTYPPHPAPSPPPPAPPTPTCNGSCQVSNFVNSSDVTSPHLYSHSNSSTVTDCCAKCKADTACAAFVWGPYEFDKGPLSCFLFKNHGTPLKKKPGRTYGCLRAAK